MGINRFRVVGIFIFNLYYSGRDQRNNKRCKERIEEMKYRKKPVVIEAVQFVDTEESILKLSELGLDPVRIDYADLNNPILKIETLEGLMIATEGDYIIKGVQGEFYPCKPDIFAETYEELEYLNILDTI
jgi:uncharacterized 10.3 kDa protein in GP2-GP6 intergenic region